MTGRDPSLTIPTLPALARGTGSPSFPLESSPGPEHDPPFELRAHGLRVEGGHARGIDALWAGDGPSGAIALDLAVDGARAERSTVSPLGLERRLRAAGVEVVERVVAAPADPVVFLEWIAGGDVEITVRWRVPVKGARWHSDDGGLVVAPSSRRRLYLLSRPAEELSVRAGDSHELLVAARFDLKAAERVVIAIAEAAADADADEARVLRVMGRPHVAVPARRAAALRTLQSTLALEVDAPVSEALDWARLSLATEPLSGGAVERGGVSERWLRVALAGLAVGDTSVARSVIRAGGAEPAEEAEEAEEAEDAGWLVLVARYLAWTGDLVLVKEHWGRATERADRIAQEGPAGGSAPDLRRRALVELAVAAEEVGDAALAKRARQAAGDEASVPALRWSGASVRSDVGLESAAVVEEVVDGLLRVEADAPRGRLVLRPRFPPTWSRCVVRGLTMGEAVVEMEYGAEGGAHRWTVRQRRGGAPITLIFEPEMPGARVVAARVDGVDAELDVVSVEGCVRVAVQLVLDHERRVEVEIEGPDD